MTQNSYSKFWLDNDDHFDDIEKQILSPKELEARDAIKMASYRRAISNFVCILTGQQIPVIFYQKGDSLTDGKKVIISADFKDKDFDPTVGLALHEGAHIVKSDFLLLKNLVNKIPTQIYDLAKTKGLDDKKEVSNILHLILNYVEDRYIDDYVYTSAPGYRGYYVALYNKYFHSPEVDEGLRSSNYREEDIDSYFFRLINLTNKSTNLNALKGLAEIEKILNLGDIQRLSKPKDRLNLSFDIARIIFNCIDVVDKSKKKKDKGEKGEGEPGDDEGEGEEIDLTGEGDIEGVSGGGWRNEDKEEGKGKKIKSIRLTQEQLEKLMKKIQEQKDFLEGGVKKNGLTPEEKSEMDSIEDSGTDLVVVGRELKGTFSSKGVECIVVKKMTESTIASPTFPFKGDPTRGQKNITEGIRIGTLLGRRLQIRGESRDTKYLRQNSGRIEKRLINSLGYDYERVFSQISISKYKKAALHVSVDGSSSMSHSSKWDKAMTCVVAMCKAASMIENLRIVVSFRSCDNNPTSSNPRPYIIIAYDSAKDKFSKVKSMFGKLGAGGSTPEGLSFEAILKLVPPSNAECDSYFLNLSDGEPCFGGYLGGFGGYSTSDMFQYSGEPAARHTRKQIERFRQEGIRILSYFIESGGYYGREEDNTSRRLFKTMYGVDARFIDVTNVVEIAKTMNQRFLEK